VSIEPLASRSSCDIHDAETVAPFAEFPEQFWTCGRCDRCQQYNWVENLVVYAAGTRWPQVYVSTTLYCEDCMIIMGVGLGK
jgi:hypothetical protein